MPYSRQRCRLPRHRWLNSLRGTSRRWNRRCGAYKAGHNRMRLPHMSCRHHQGGSPGWSTCRQDLDGTTPHTCHCSRRCSRHTLGCPTRSSHRSTPCQCIRIRSQRHCRSGCSGLHRRGMQRTLNQKWLCRTDRSIAENKNFLSYPRKSWRHNRGFQGRGSLRPTDHG